MVASVEVLHQQVSPWCPVLLLPSHPTCSIYSQPERHRNAYQRYVTPHLICRSHPRWWCRLHSRCSESDLCPEKPPRSHPNLWSKYNPKNWSRSNFPLKNMSPGKMFMYVGPLYFSQTLLYIQRFAKQTALFAFQFSSRPTTKLCTSWLYQWGSSVPAWRPVCRCVVSVCSTEPPSGASPAPSVSVALLTVTCNLYTGYIHSWATPQCNYIFLSTNLILSGIWASIQACGFGAPNDDDTFQGYFWYNLQS